MPEATHIEGFDLSDMEYDEISLVTRGGCQEADVVIFKSAGGKDCEEGHSQLGDGEKCEFCDYTGKGGDKKVKKAEPFVVKPVPVPARIEKGDKPGHPFRGNQYGSGTNGGDKKYKYKTKSDGYGAGKLDSITASRKTSTGSTIDVNGSTRHGLGIYQAQITSATGRVTRGRFADSVSEAVDWAEGLHKRQKARAATKAKKKPAGTGRQKYPKGDPRNTPRSASDQARFGKPKKKATRGETFGTWQSESSNGMKMSRNGDMTIRQSDSGSFVVSDHGQRIEHQIPRGATMAQARRHVEDTILAPRMSRRKRK